jgi:hypothetical protein
MSVSSWTTPLDPLGACAWAYAGHAQWPVDWRMDAGMHTWAGHAQTFFFSKCPFVTARHAHSGTYWHINGGEEGMYNRVEELLKGGQR